MEKKPLIKGTNTEPHKENEYTDTLKPGDLDLCRGTESLYRGVILRLLDSYNYGAALEIMSLYPAAFGKGTDGLYELITACRYSLQFDFKSALAALDQTAQLPEGHAVEGKAVSLFRRELPFLIAGVPEYIFNELLDNLVIQLEKGDYTGFLGRVFQLRELLLKYAVIQYKEGKTYSLRDRIYQKAFFEHRFKLYHGLMNGMKDILQRAGGRWMKLVQLLTGKQMGELMDLRHRTIVAHGIETVTLEDINLIYGSEDLILEDLERVFELLNIPVHKNKYREINREIGG